MRVARATRPARAEATLDWLLLVGLCLAFAPAFLSMSRVWGAVDYQAHGYLIAPVAAAMAWSRRGALARAGRLPHAGGALLWLVAMAAYAVGLLAGLTALQGVAFPVALAGLLAWRRGFSAVSALGFPLAYLLFLVPVPPQGLAPLVTGLQSLVIGVAIALLQVLHVPALREGNVLLLPEGSLFVAEACSGITSIVTLLPLAGLLLFLTPGARCRGVWLLLAVFPIATFWNLVRVLCTVAAVRSLGVAKATTGSLHDAAGMLTFVMGCLTLVALGARLPGRAAPAGRTGT